MREPIPGGDGLSRVPHGQPTQRLAAVERLVARHRSVSQLPCDPRCDAVIDRICAAQDAGVRVVLDAGCGTGESTVGLARRYEETRDPDARTWVLGVDKSYARLGRGSIAPESGGQVSHSLVRADLAQLWVCMSRRKVVVDMCYLLYPNPWPKAKHMVRRWYGHPCFASILATCRSFEMRTNWEIYGLEFAHAVGLFDVWCVEHAQIDPATLSASAKSPFERKYAQSGHRMWRVVGQGPI